MFLLYRRLRCSNLEDLSASIGVDNYEDIISLINITCNGGSILDCQCYRVGNEIYLKGCFNFGSNIVTNKETVFGILPYTPSTYLRLPCVGNPSGNTTPYASRCFIYDDGRISFISGTSCVQFTLDIGFRI